MRIRVLAESFLLAGWLFGLLAWGYVCATVLDPITAPYQTAPFSYYVNIPTDLVAHIAFLVAFICFIGWFYLRVTRLQDGKS